MGATLNEFESMHQFSKNYNRFETRTSSMKTIKMMVHCGLIQAVMLGSVLQLCNVTAEAQSPTRVSAAAPTTNQQDPLLVLVDQAIEVSKVRYLDVRHHTAWQILHGLLALRNDYELLNGTGKVNAIEYISNGAQLKGSYWFEKTSHGGRAHPYNGVMYDFEGHVNQSLAIIAMSNLPLTHKFQVANGQFVTMQDMVNHAKMNVSSKEEITWTLWFLTHYLDQDSEWINAQGEPWSMEKLVRLQNESSVYNTPCGGSHGLFALAYARNAYLQKHGQLRGEWLRGDQKLQQFISAAQSMQNRDGTFSTKMFKAYGHSYDFDERLKSTGHMTEWLMMALPKKRLEERWVKSAVNSIASDMVRNASKPAECGGMYHALHALILYKQRMAPSTPSVQPIEQPAADLASNPVPKSGPIVSNINDDSAYPSEAVPNSTSVASDVKMTTPEKSEEVKTTEVRPAAPSKPTQVAEVPKELKATQNAPLPPVNELIMPEPYRPEATSTTTSITATPVQQSSTPMKTTDAPVLRAPILMSEPKKKQEDAKVEKMEAVESKEVQQAVPQLEQIPNGLMPFLKPAVIGELEELSNETETNVSETEANEVIGASQTTEVDDEVFVDEEFTD